MNGLKVLEELSDAPLPAIIFVTAYDQYAIRAFNFHGDYMLVLGNATKLPLSRNYRDRFFDKFGKP